jgi:hypothetical protein
MTDWKDQLKEVYKNLQQDQKNKKGLQSKFENVVGYKKKKGFNDTGIPLTARAAKNLQKNKASYRHRYVGTTLQQINEKRAAAAKQRWKNVGAGHRHSTDKAPTKKGYSSSELMWRNSATARGDRSDGWSNQRSTFVGYGYGDTPTDDESVEIDLSYYKEKSVIETPPNFDESKFPKVAEAIWQAKKVKR